MSVSLSQSMRQTKYHGNNELVLKDSSENTRLIIELIKLSQESDEKSDFRNEIKKCVTCLQSDDHQLRAYQLAILEETVVPYLQEILHSKGGMLSALKPILASTRFTRESRYSQLEMILKLLIEPSTSVNEHPANILNELETILHDIKSEENLFQSKLSVLLSKSLQKQWRPIVSDHRRSLQSIGSKLVILGLVEVIGKPIVMLYPIYNLLITIQDIFQLGVAEVRPAAKSLTLSQIVTLIKAIGLLLVTMQLIWVLSSYTGLGYACLGIGVTAITGSSSDDFIKRYSAPLFSQYLIKMELFIDQVSKIENISWFATTSNNTQHTTTTIPAATTLIPDDVDDAVHLLTSTTRVDPVSSLDPAGVRRRKFNG